jgi:hypothetical protein
LYTANELRIDGHLGGSAAHSSFIGFEPTSGVAVAVLVDVEDPTSAAFMAFEAVGARTGEDVSPPSSGALE